MSEWPTQPQPAQIICDFAVPGDPSTKARARVTINGTYTPPATKRWEGKVRDYLKVAHPHLKPDGLHSLGVRLLFSTLTRQRRDIDNLAKVVLDALTGAAWVDDYQIDELVISVTRGTAQPETHVTVYALGERRIACAHCGSPVKTTQHKRFCSKACYDETQRRGRYVHCFTCAKRLYRQNDKLDQERWFCSPKCKQAANSGNLICRQCQREFRVFRSAVNRRVFCSPQCGATFHATRSRELTRQHRYRVACPTCSGPMSRKGAQGCRSCYFRRIAAAQAASSVGEVRP